MITLPREPFCELGLDRQKQVAAAGFQNALTIGLANDYLATPSTKKNIPTAATKWTNASTTVPDRTACSPPKPARSTKD
jgi:hypothetical protein